jgi:predicted porin
MKRLPLALAIAGLTGSVLAQSTVTVYGIADSGIASGSGSGAGSANRTFLTSGANMTSRIGFRGTEDLGGGLSASFNLEAQVFVDSGEGQPTNISNQPAGTGVATVGTQGLTFARRSTVSLHGGLGEVRLGRDFTAHYRNRVEVDPFGNAGVGAAQPFVGSLGGSVSTRASNMIAYFLPSSLGGIYGQVQYYMGENASGAVTSGDGTGQSFRVGYAAGDLNVSFAAAKTSYATTATAGDIDVLNLGIQYKLGPVRLMGGLYRDNAQRTVKITGEGWTLGGIWSVGTGDMKFSISEYGTDVALKPKTSKLALGYVHNLSKRTALYATLASVTNSGGATTALNQSVTAANASSMGFDLGIRHAF